MDEQQFAALVQKVLSRIRDESAGIPILPKAYILMPEDWQTQYYNQCLDILEKIQREYHITAVLPDYDNGDINNLYNMGVSATVKRSEAVFPENDFLTIFPIACRGLVVKAALCLQDDFESNWVANCIAHGRAVLMPKELPLFTGNEPDAYKKRILSYYKEAESFGILFDTFSPKLGAMPKSTKFDGEQKKKIITKKDLEAFCSAKELWLDSGDIVTALATEHAKELGISILHR